MISNEMPTNGQFVAMLEFNDLLWSYTLKWENKNLFQFDESSNSWKYANRFFMKLPNVKYLVNNNSGKLNTYITVNDNNKIFNHHINGKRYSFNVDYLPEEEYEWFTQVVGKIMNEIYYDANTTAKNEIQNDFRKLIEKFLPLK